MAANGAAVKRSPAERKGEGRLRLVGDAPANPGRESGLRVVDAPARARLGIAVYFWVGVVAIATGLAVMVISQVLLTQATFKTSEARSELARAQAENERLRLEKARAESPTLLEERARRDLGMVVGQSPERLNLGPLYPNSVPLAPVGDYGQIAPNPVGTVAGDAQPVKPPPTKTAATKAAKPTTASPAPKASAKPSPTPSPATAQRR